MMLQNDLEEKRSWWDGSSVYRAPALSHEEQNVDPRSHVRDQALALKPSGAGAGSMSPSFKKISCLK